MHGRRCSIFVVAVPVPVVQAFAFGELEDYLYYNITAKDIRILIFTFYSYMKKENAKCTFGVFITVT
jgi:hypothetical protein